MKKPFVSIIILNWNGLPDTLRCLSSLQKTFYPNFDVIVVDNGSSINEAKLLSSQIKDKRMKFIRFSRNFGFTGGNNRALKNTNSKYIVLLNNDTRVKRDWLKRLVEVMELDSKIAVAQPKILLMNNNEYFDYAGAAGGYIDKYGYPFTRGRIFEVMEKDKGQYDEIANIFWASGAAMIIRRRVIKKAGGLFDERLFNYMEEIDFCWRVWRKGYRVVCVPQSVVYHKVAATAQKNLFMKRFWEHRNNLLILTKNLSRKDLVKTLTIRSFFEFAAYVYYIVTRKFKFVGSLFLAHLSFLKMVFSTRFSRFKTYPDGIPPIYPGSIVIDHFFGKKSHFSQLNWTPKPTIAYLVYSTKENTGSRVVFEHANRFISKGYNIVIYTLLGKQPRWFPLKAQVKHFWRSHFDKIPNILVATFWPTAYLVFLMKGEHKFYFSQEWEEDFYTNPVLRLAARLTYTLPIEKIVISRYLEDRVKEFDKSGQKTHWIRYATLDTAYFLEKNLRGKRRKKKIKILSVISWYNKHKGPDLLVKAVKELKKKHLNYHFVLVSREKKPYADVFDEFFSSPKLAKLVKLYNEADVFLITSRTEGFFIPGVEAMACGCPVITTNCRGVLDYAKDKENAIVLRGLSELWERNIIEKLIRNKQLKRKLIVNGLRTARKYNLENITEDFERIYLEALKTY